MGEISFAVLSLSTRASQGVYEDKSGNYLREKLQSFCGSSGDYFLLADDEIKLASTLEEIIEQKTDLIFTTGGTGIGTQDITIEVVQPMIDKFVPGVMEFIRTKYGYENRNALLSRGVCGLAKRSLIFTLPGSIKAVKEYWQEIEPLLAHMLQMKADIDSHGRV